MSPSRPPAVNARAVFGTILLAACLLLYFNTQVLSKTETTLLILGDSLTAGYGVEKEQAFPFLLQQLLDQEGFSDVNVVNGGFSGSTTASAIQRMKWYMRIKPDIVIIELGANDGLRGHPVESIRANLEETIQFALENGIVTILAGMKLPVNYGKNYTQDFEEMFKQLADKYDLPFIPFILKDVAGDPSLNLPDGIHPNPEGHQIIARHLLSFVKPLLKEYRTSRHSSRPRPKTK